MNRRELISSLPTLMNNREIVKDRQTINDIIKEIIAAHKRFASDYDKICLDFDGPDIRTICNNIYGFLKSNSKYKEESENEQTTKSPAAIIQSPTNDCKHYASFAGGVLDGLSRRGVKINWCYRFASYDFFSRQPQHVFVVVNDNGHEIWIDPVPGSENVSPVWQKDKKIKVNNSNMALYRISGVDDNVQIDYPITDILDRADYQENYQLWGAIQLLLTYGVMDMNAKVNDHYLLELQNILEPESYQELVNARQVIQANAIGSLFSKIWHGVKVVSMAGPRAAFLSLVGLNVFGMAYKLYHSLFDSNGNYSSFKDTLYNKWDSIGGTFDKLVGTIKHGHTLKPILANKTKYDKRIGQAAAAALPLWLTISSAVIAAIMPIVKAFLAQKSKTTGVDYNIDPTTGQTLDGSGANNIPVNTTGSTSFIQKYGLMIAAGATAIFLLTSKKRKTA